LANETVLGFVPKVGAVPAPDSATFCGLPLTLSAMVSAAARLPAAAGVKVTFTVVLFPAVIVIGSVPGVKTNSVASVPVILRFEITKSAVPVLASVIGVATLVVVTS